MAGAPAPLPRKPFAKRRKINNSPVKTIVKSAQKDLPMSADVGKAPRPAFVAGFHKEGSMDSRAPGSVSSPVSSVASAKSHPHEGRNFWVLTAYGISGWRCSAFSRTTSATSFRASDAAFHSGRRSTTAQACAEVCPSAPRVPHRTPPRAPVSLAVLQWPAFHRCFRSCDQVGSTDRHRSWRYEQSTEPPTSRAHALVKVLAST